MSARFTAGQAAWAAGAQLLSGAPDQMFEGAFTDSRTPVPGALFVALVGERHDGSLFAAAAAQAGAGGVLVPSSAAARVRDELAAQGLRPALLAAQDTGRALGRIAHAWRESLPGIRVVCVTGSTGKTSTKELVASVLETAGPTLKTEGNLTNEVGVPLTLLRLSPAHRNAVIEAGMNHLGEIARLAAWADPDVGLVTNAGPVHLEGVGSMDGVAHAKGELFHALRESATAVANADDPRVLQQARLSRRRLITFGASTAADVRLISAHHGGPGLRVELAFPDGKTRMTELHLIGTHNGHNAAAAAAVGFGLGLDPDHIVRGLGGARTTGRRGKGRAIAVLGDMLELGPTELDLHRDVGRFAAGAGLALLVCFGQRARAIGEGAMEAGIAPAHVQFADDPAQAVEIVRRQARPEDVILVKGSRGMKMERISDPLAGLPPGPGAH